MVYDDVFYCLERYASFKKQIYCLERYVSFQKTNKNKKNK